MGPRRPNDIPEPLKVESELADEDAPYSLVFRWPA